MQTRDLEDSSERPITVERKGTRLVWTWPCGQEFDVSRAKYRKAMAALDALPKPSAGLVFRLTAVDLYRDGSVDWDVTFTPESKTRVRVYAEAEGESALMPYKDLRAAADL